MARRLTPASTRPPATTLVLLATVAASAAVAVEPGGPAHGGDAGRQRMQVLWYTRPAGRWAEALPVGNGRLGAMVHGGTAQQIGRVASEGVDVPVTPAPDGAASLDMKAGQTYRLTFR
jgi:alpha-L-fucosidase 2